MFDWVPVRAWLLIMIVAIGWVPAIVTYRYAKSSANVDDVIRRLDDERPSRDQFIWSVSVLLVLTGLAIFIFTPAAEQFAHSSVFWPLLCLAFALFCLHATIKGAVEGFVEPMIRGSFGPYSKIEQPVRYWLSMGWNAVMVIVLSCGTFWMQSK